MAQLGVSFLLMTQKNNTLFTLFINKNHFHMKPNCYITNKIKWNCEESEIKENTLSLLLQNIRGKKKHYHYRNRTQHFVNLWYTKNNLLSIAFDAELLVEVHPSDPRNTNHHHHIFRKGFVVHQPFIFQFSECNFILFLIGRVGEIFVKFI